MSLQNIPLDKIVPSPFNTRVEFGDIAGLSSSISRGGLANPLKLRPVGDHYEVVTGGRRLQALQQSGATSAEAIVQEMTDEQVILEQWEENHQRLDLSDYETALKLWQMQVQLGWNRQQIALKLDRDEIWISDHLKILQLEPFVSPSVLTKLTVKQTKAILKAPEEITLDLVDEIEQRFNEDGYIMSSKTIQEYVEYLEATKGTTPESIEEEESITTVVTEPVAAQPLREEDLLIDVFDTIIVAQAVDVGFLLTEDKEILNLRNEEAFLEDPGLDKLKIRRWKELEG